MYHFKVYDASIIFHLLISRIDQVRLSNALAHAKGLARSIHDMNS